MRSLVTLIFFVIAFLLPVFPLVAEISNVDRADLYSRSILQSKNPGFENGKAGWTSSGGTFATVTSGTNLLLGGVSATWDSSAASQIFASSLVTIPKGLYGSNGVVQIKTQVPSGTATHLIQVYDGTNILTSQTIASTTSPAIQQVNFIFPSSGSLQIRIVSVAADEPLIAIDDAFMGPAFNVAPISQATLFAAVAYDVAANCDVTTTSGTVAEVADDADCNVRAAWGEAQFVNNRFKMRVPKVPPGRYELIVQLPIWVDVSSTLCEMYVTQTGSNMPLIYTAFSNVERRSTTLHMAFETSVAQGQVDFFMNWRRLSVGGTCHITTTGLGGVGFMMTLKKFPTGSETAYTPELANWKVDATITGGAAFNLGSASVASLTTPNDSGQTLTQNAGSIPVQITCSGTNPPTGTTCAAGNEEPGISFTPPRGGATVMACVSFGHMMSDQSNAAAYQIDAVFRIVETPINAQTTTQAGPSRMPSSLATTQVTDVVRVLHPIRLCSPFRFEAGGQKALRLQYTQVASGTIGVNELGSGGPVAWEVYPIDISIPSPLLVGSVISSTSGVERVEHAFLVNNGSTCVAASTSGSWLTTPGTRNGAGDCSFTISGFSARPSCVCTVDDLSRVCSVASSSTSVLLRMGTYVSTTGTATDFQYNVVCMGPKQ